MKQLIFLFSFFLFLTACQQVAPTTEGTYDSPATAAQAAPASANNVDASQQIGAFPEARGWVNDFEGILSIAEEEQLAQQIAAFEENNSFEIAVITIKSHAPYPDIASYSRALGNEWGVGKKDLDNGLLLVVCKEKRMVHIATGKGTENNLNNQQCQDIIDQYIAPDFGKGDFYGGIKKGLDRIMTSL